MALTFVGAASASSTSVTPPTGNVGDLLLVFSFRSAVNTAPTLPSGWTNLDNAGSGGESFRVGYKIATSTVDSSGTWTNATQIILVRLKGQAADPAWIGGHSRTANSTSTITYAAVTLIGTPAAMLLSFAADVSATAIPTRVGFTRDATQGSAPIAIGEHIVAPGGGSETVTATGTAGAWFEYQLEILPATILGTAAGSLGGLSGSATGKRQVNGTGTVALAGLSGSATSQKLVHGSGSGSLGALSGTATGKRTVLGTASEALGGLAGTATGVRTRHGTALGSLGALTGSGTGQKLVSGSAAASLGGLIGTAAGKRTAHGTAVGSLGALAGSALGVRQMTGIASGVLGGLVGSAVGQRAVVGSGGVALGELIGSAIGTGVTPSPIVTRPNIGSTTRPSDGTVTRPSTGLVTRPA